MKTVSNEYAARELINQARSKIKSGALADAEELLKKALDYNSLRPDILYYLGAIAFKRDKYNDAMEFYEQIFSINDKYVAAREDYAAAFLRLKQATDAIHHAEQALTIDPNRPSAHNTKGAALMALLRPDDALPEFVKSLEKKPEFVPAMSNIGAYYRAMNQDQNALKWYSRALAIDPTDIEANFSRSITHLRLGNYLEGFAAYEWRFRRSDMKAGLRMHDRPRWLGQLSLSGATILLQEEQGLGDTIQFSRYAIALANHGAKVVLEVKSSLRALFSCFEDRMTVITEGDPLPEFDCHSPLMSLAFACGTTVETIPSSRKYLTAPVERQQIWSDRLGPRSRPRVGIVWRGQPAHTKDQIRSMSLEDFPIPNTDLFDVYSFQHVIRDEDRSILDSLRIKQLGREFSDMADTAAALQLMDLVIAVDTSVAHLAAALGKPTWLLLALDSDWRWLDGREDSPWYPTIRMFKQTKYNDWTDVVSNVASALRQASIPANQKTSEA